jgi:hypothetical protein
MRSVSRAILLASGVLIGTGTANGQVPNADSSQLQDAIITIQTDVDSALVFVDGVRAGVTPLALNSLTSGTHFLRLFHPDLPNWLTGSITDSIQIVAGESRTLRYTFEHRSLVTSSPFGADVYVADSLYGTTPLVMALSGQSGPPVISIRKEGYEPMTANLADAKRGVLSLRLPQRWQTEGIAGAVLDDGGRLASKNLRLYVTGGSTVLAGITAAYFKTRADDLYTDYTRTGDPSLLSKTHRLDTAAAIALAITQVGLGLFTYYILSE